MKRSTTTRDKHRSRLRRGQPPCGISGQPIDYSLRYPDPRSFTVDHIIPLALGGTDDPSNCQPAHRHCNRQKGAHVDDGPALRRSASLRRSREW